MRGYVFVAYSYHSFLFEIVGFVHGTCPSPDTDNILLAHGETCDAEVVRDVADDQRAESRIQDGGDQESRVYDHSHVMWRVLYYRWTVM